MRTCEITMQLGATCMSTCPKLVSRKTSVKRLCGYTTTQAPNGALGLQEGWAWAGLAMRN